MPQLFKLFCYWFWPFKQQKVYSKMLVQEVSISAENEKYVQSNGQVKMPQGIQRLITTMARQTSRRMQYGQL